MKEQVQLTIKGIHNTADAGQDAIETIYPARYFQKKGIHYLFYEEILEETGEAVPCSIRIGTDYLEVRKTGPLQTHMIFRPEIRTTTSYRTIYGTFQMGIYTKSMKQNQQKESLQIQADYILELNDEVIAESRIQITVK